MTEVKNLNQKRVGDISLDQKQFFIQIKGFITRMSANPDGTLRIENQQQKR